MLPNVRYFVAAILVIGFAVPAIAQQPDKRKPNIIVVLADDFGYECVTANGGKSYKTPNLDKLAASGAKLEQFYVQPVCSPTRASLMTGRYPMRYGLQVGVIRP